MTKPPPPDDDNQLAASTFVGGPEKPVEDSDMLQAPVRFSLDTCMPEEIAEVLHLRAKVLKRGAFREPPRPRGAAGERAKT